MQVRALCGRAGLAGLGHVSGDGTKLRANASKHKAMSYGRMPETQARLEREVHAWFERAATVDAAEEREHGARRGDYRILYRIVEADQTVLVVRVAHRATAYRPRG